MLRGEGHLSTHFLDNWVSPGRAEACDMRAMRAVKLSNRFILQRKKKARRSRYHQYNKKTHLRDERNTNLDEVEGKCPRSNESNGYHGQA
jgi:hypothetical protein